MKNRRFLSLMLFTLLIFLSLTSITFAAQKPGTVKLISAKQTSNYKNIQVKWKKIRCTGYKIYVEPGGDGKVCCVKNIKKNTTTKCTIPIKEKYHAEAWICVKAYNKYGSKVYYGHESGWEHIIFKIGSGATIDPRAASLAKDITNKWYPQLQEKYKLKNGFLSESEHIIATRDFGELSDAMKIFAIGRSGMFTCRYSRKSFGVVYDSYSADISDNMSILGRLKALNENTAIGVCMDYARYEKAYFDSLNIKSWINAGKSHAWTVVKVENSAGKVMWIPFDYGIGPSVVYGDKDVDERFAAYMYGIKGNPKCKNYNSEDFI